MDDLVAISLHDVRLEQFTIKKSYITVTALDPRVAMLELGQDHLSMALPGLARLPTLWIGRPGTLPTDRHCIAWGSQPRPHIPSPTRPALSWLRTTRQVGLAVGQLLLTSGKRNRDG